MATKLLKGAAIKPVECWSTESYKYFVASGWFCYLILDLSTPGLDFVQSNVFSVIALEKYRSLQPRFNTHVHLFRLNI